MYCTNHYDVSSAAKHQFFGTASVRRDSRSGLRPMLFVRILSFRRPRNPTWHLFDRQRGKQLLRPQARAWRRLARPDLILFHRIACSQTLYSSFSFPHPLKFLSTNSTSHLRNSIFIITNNTQ